MSRGYKPNRTSGGYKPNKTPDGGRIDQNGVYHSPEEVAGYKAGVKRGYKQGCNAGAAYVAKSHGVYVPKKNRLW